VRDVGHMSNCSPQLAARNLRCGFYRPTVNHNIPFEPRAGIGHAGLVYVEQLDLLSFRHFRCKLVYPSEVRFHLEVLRWTSGAAESRQLVGAAALHALQRFMLILGAGSGVVCVLYFLGLRQRA
jgi:hypothetical protein